MPDNHPLSASFSLVRDEVCVLVQDEIFVLVRDENFVIVVDEISCGVSSASLGRSDERSLSLGRACFWGWVG